MQRCRNLTKSIPLYILFLQTVFLEIILKESISVQLFPSALAYISATILTTSIYFSPGHIPYMRDALYRVYCFRCLFPCHYIKLFFLVFKILMYLQLIMNPILTRTKPYFLALFHNQKSCLLIRNFRFHNKSSSNAVCSQKYNIINCYTTFPSLVVISNILLSFSFLSRNAEMASCNS